MQIIKEKYYNIVLPGTISLAAFVTSLIPSQALANHCPSGFHHVGVTCGPDALPGGNGNTTLGGIIALAFRYALILAGIIAVAMIIWGGFKVLTAGGKDDAYKEGITYIKNAAIGLALIILALAIVRFIESAITGVAI